MSPSLVHFIGYMKGKRFMSNSSRELCIMFKNICNKETFPVSDWISSSWLAFWSCPIFYIIRWNYNFYKVLHHVEKGGWSRFSLLCKLSLETLKTTAAHFTHSFLRYNACMLGCARLLDTKAPSLKQPFKKEQGQRTDCDCIFTHTLSETSNVMCLRSYWLPSGASWERTLKQPAEVNVHAFQPAGYESIHHYLLTANHSTTCVKCRTT